MRTIKFRGKRLDNGEWVYGGFHEHTKRQICPIGDELTNKDTCSLIIQSGFADWDMRRPIIAFEVLPESVGQWTGLVDRYSKEIYEGDIVKCVSRLDMAHMIVLFEEGEFRMVLCEDYDSYKPGMGFYALRCFEKEIIGNVFDNGGLYDR